MRITARGLRIVLSVAGLVGAGSNLLLGRDVADAGILAVHQYRTHAHEQGAPRPAVDREKIAGVVKALGSHSAGAYVDRTGRVVVTVTDRDDAQRVFAAGAVPKLVPYSSADLGRAAAMLQRASLGPGTGWGLDPRTDTVTVWTDQTVIGTRMRRLAAVVRHIGPRARIQPLHGQLHTLAGATETVGGDAIFGPAVRCSLGFDVHNATHPFFITAGHCGRLASTWAADRAGTTPLGNTVESAFPGHDYALVNRTAPGASLVDLFNGQTRLVTAAADPLVGEQVSRAGSTTGIRTGIVNAQNATVNLVEGSVSGMVQTTICSEFGDSGGPLFVGTTALGITSSGSGDCAAGGITFFQPIVPALRTLGVQVGTA